MTHRVIGGMSYEEQLDILKLSNKRKNMIRALRNMLGFSMIVNVFMLIVILMLMNN